jgi:hypothetical protein
MNPTPDYRERVSFASLPDAQPEIVHKCHAIACPPSGGS